MNNKNNEHDIFPLNDFGDVPLSNDFEVNSAKNSEEFNPAQANYGHVEPGKNQMLYYHFRRIAAVENLNNVKEQYDLLHDILKGLKHQPDGSSYIYQEENRNGNLSKRKVTKEASIALVEGMIESMEESVQKYIEATNLLKQQQEAQAQNLTNQKTAIVARLGELEYILDNASDLTVQDLEQLKSELESLRSQIYHDYNSKDKFEISGIVVSYGKIKRFASDLIDIADEKILKLAGGNVPQGQ